MKKQTIDSLSSFGQNILFLKDLELNKNRQKFHILEIQFSSKDRTPSIYDIKEK